MSQHAGLEVCPHYSVEYITEPPCVTHLLSDAFAIGQSLVRPPAIVPQLVWSVQHSLTLHTLFVVIGRLGGGRREREGGGVKEGEGGRSEGGREGEEE